MTPRTDPLDVAGRVPEWTLGDRIRKARRSAGLEQSELAEALAANTKSVGRWELDLTRPNRSTLVAVALVTGVSLRWLEGEN